MRTGISLSVTPADNGRLRDLVKDRNAPQKHVMASTDCDPACKSGSDSILMKLRCPLALVSQRGSTPCNLFEPQC